ncbi:hypothetical protein JF66_02885 [Cryobacterium sp. MLB-32]|uniref:DUF4870 domain-containing protein n=1 Tax=Cryobacterium sp. MLB-32 TaxID=1529318 RepID=UPI0004E6627E|nr:DUF4870 domain-containing protein [Cryobacterium sp. MLB-32]KFF60676.1 hypothetical protein JF66_02885 [Cryobacterium sp. MLB-32]
MSDATPPVNPYQSTGAPLSPADEKLWATLIHVGGIFFCWVPLLNCVPALIGYLLLRDRGPFIRAHTATALNFQITMAIGLTISAALLAIAIGALTAFAIWIIIVVFSIIAALAANRGEGYTYPLSLRFVS